MSPKHKYCLLLDILLYDPLWQGNHIENCKINFRSVQTEHPLIIQVKESFSIAF
jgi:hypothetical protein